MQSFIKLTVINNSIIYEVNIMPHGRHYKDYNTFMKIFNAFDEIDPATKQIEKALGYDDLGRSIIYDEWGNRFVSGMPSQSAINTKYS